MHLRDTAHSLHMGDLKIISPAAAICSWFATNVTSTNNPEHRSRLLDAKVTCKVAACT